MAERIHQEETAKRITKKTQVRPPSDEDDEEELPPLVLDTPPQKSKKEKPRAPPVEVDIISPTPKGSKQPQRKGGYKKLTADAPPQHSSPKRGNRGGLATSDAYEVCMCNLHTYVGYTYILCNTLFLEKRCGKEKASGDRSII